MLFVRLTQPPIYPSTCRIYYTASDNRKNICWLHHSVDGVFLSLFLHSRENIIWKTTCSDCWKDETEKRREKALKHYVIQTHNGWISPPEEKKKTASVLWQFLIEWQFSECHSADVMKNAFLLFNLNIFQWRAGWKKVLGGLPPSNNNKRSCEA